MFQDFFGGLFDIIFTLIKLVFTTVTSLLELISNIPSYLTLLITSINVLPSFIIPFAVAYITLVVVQYIVGKRVED